MENKHLLPLISVVFLWLHTEIQTTENPSLCLGQRETLVPMAILSTFTDEKRAK